MGVVKHALRIAEGSDGWDLRDGGQILATKHTEGTERNLSVPSVFSVDRNRFYPCGTTSTSHTPLMHANS